MVQHASIPPPFVWLNNIPLYRGSVCVHASGAGHLGHFWLLLMCCCARSGARFSSFMYTCTSSDCCALVETNHFSPRLHHFAYLSTVYEISFCILANSVFLPSPWTLCAFKKHLKRSKNKIDQEGIPMTDQPLR